MAINKAQWFVIGLAIFAVGGLTINARREAAARDAAAKAAAQAQAIARERREAADREAAIKRRQEREAQCSTGLEKTMADARKLLSSGDPHLAAATLQPCLAITNDRSFKDLYAKV